MTSLYGSALASALVACAACTSGPGQNPPATDPRAQELQTPSADLLAEGDGPLLAGFPLQFKLTITNTGSAPISYWTAGPGGYPSAQTFWVRITDEAGLSRKLHLHNGQYIEGSGGHRAIVAQQTLPATCDPLPVGTYTIKISGISNGYLRDGALVVTWPAMTARPLSIEVKDDAEAFAQAEKDLMARALSDPFARHVAFQYGFDPEVRSWLEKLGDEDISIAMKAAGHLQRVRRLQPGADALLRSAALRQTGLEIDTMRANLLAYIAKISRHIKTEAALDAVLTIARAPIRSVPGHEALAGLGREAAFTELARFPQRRAEEALLRVAAVPAAPGYWAAIAALAERGNPIVIEPLLRAVAEIQNPGRRAFGLRSLGGLRDHPAVRIVLDAVMQDPDPFIRNCARFALEADPEFEADRE